MVQGQIWIVALVQLWLLPVFDLRNAARSGPVLRKLAALRWDLIGGPRHINPLRMT
jgi:type IV secretory pathway TrbD component